MSLDPARLAALGLPSAFKVVVLTGAGISAESGIPTFRGKGGLWTTGSRDYRPQELATLRAFQAMPRELWRWYLYRRGACRQAQPNAGHLALRALADRLGPQRFALVTQNIDGLHARSGIGADMLFEIHGCIETMRCTLPCTPERFPLEPSLVLASREAVLDDARWERLKCPHCGALTRPHVLWFDEYYEEALYGSDSALGRIEKADLLLIIGTSGATSLPLMMARLALQRNLAVIEVNPEPSAFTVAIQRHARGLYLASTASACVPALVDNLTTLHSSAG
jgi:NAD-dependent deacetylase